MPIYAYKCSSCDHAQDVLQKMSDPILTVCPECEQDTYVKQVTTAGFQLKGTGWYVTDFRDNKSGATGAVAPSTTSGDSSSASAPSSSAAAAPAASPAASSPSS
ncbi:MAG: zinc ribbon domain-containing protein [Burkholderiaceae bacterium]|nr:zinc ribbon domain-containing protein [Burkholderiaceae bacterium]